MVDPNLHNNRKGKTGRKGINLEPVRAVLAQMPIKSWTTIHGIAAALRLAQLTLLDNLKYLSVRDSSQYLKP